MTHSIIPVSLKRLYILRAVHRYMGIKYRFGIFCISGFKQSLYSVRTYDSPVTSSDLMISKQKNLE